MYFLPQVGECMKMELLQFPSMASDKLHGSPVTMPGHHQPLRWPTQGRIHPSAHGHPRQVPLTTLTAPACSSSLGWESSCTATQWQHLQPPRHVSPWQPHKSRTCSLQHLLLKATSVVTDSKPMDGEPIPEPSDAPVLA